MGAREVMASGATISAGIPYSSHFKFNMSKLIFIGSLPCVRPMVDIRDAWMTKAQFLLLKSLQREDMKVKI